MSKISADALDLPESVVAKTDQNKAVHIAPSGDDIPPAETPWAVEIAAPNTYYDYECWTVMVTAPNPDRGGIHDAVEGENCTTRREAIERAEEFVQQYITED